MRPRLLAVCACLAVVGFVTACESASPSTSAGTGEWTSIAQAPGVPGGADFTTPRDPAAPLVPAATPQPVAPPSPPVAVAAPTPTPLPPPEPAVTPPEPAPAADATPEFTFRFSVGDEVDVRIWRETELSATHTVLHDGTISPPLLDPVRIEGLTIREVRGTLTPLYQKYIKDPRISVRVVNVHSSRIYVLGEVRTPQAVVATGRLSLMQVLAQSGGFVLESADRERVRVVRPVPGGTARVMTVNANAVLSGGTRDVPLQPGDVVFVPSTGLSDWSRRLSQLLGPVGTLLGSVGSVATTIVAVDSLNN